MNSRFVLVVLLMTVVRKSVSQYEDEPLCQYEDQVLQIKQGVTLETKPPRKHLDNRLLQVGLYSAVADIGVHSPLLACHFDVELRCARRRSAYPSWSPTAVLSRASP